VSVAVLNGSVEEIRDVASPMLGPLREVLGS
jgi:hypothetical protein